MTDKLPSEYFGDPALDSLDCPVLPYLTDTELEMLFLAMEEQADRYYLFLACN